ncbi:gliding motility-associated C-terminal domain-containing protein [Joostella sp. CR20]|uniref:gliding motility-associated C-terminal domain-containing protein n=1 Tax=Joostella sp. CR20 TaxID=2804312 RepID=UPI00313E2D73
MSRKYKITMLVIVGQLLLLNVKAVAQTTNTGQFYVSPNTQVSVLDNFSNQDAAELYNDGEIHFNADFANNAVFDFLEEGGLTAFTGSQTQLLSGTSESYFYNTLFDNALTNDAFSLEGLINITNLATFSSGIVNQDDFGGAITFEENATSDEASDNSFVDGFVNKVGSDFVGFEMPIGDGIYYRHLDLSSSLTTSTVYRSKYYFENSNELYSHNSKEETIDYIDTQEYWEVQGVTDATSTTATLYRDAATTASSILNEASEFLHLVRWDEDTNMWVDEGGVISSDGNGISATIRKDGIIALAVVATVDPNPTPECGDIVIHNAITANNDGSNDFFKIERENEGECNYTEPIHVKIYNRWGVLVFESDNYGTDASGDVFRGYSEGRLTINNNQLLPTGTYFYIMQFNYTGNGEQKNYNKSGYLYLTSD